MVEYICKKCGTQLEEVWDSNGFDDGLRLDCPSCDGFYGFTVVKPRGDGDA